MEFVYCCLNLMNIFVTVPVLVLMDQTVLTVVSLGTIHVYVHEYMFIKFMCACVHILYHTNVASLYKSISCTQIMLCMYALTFITF